MNLVMRFKVAATNFFQKAPETAEALAKNTAQVIRQAIDDGRLAGVHIMNDMADMVASTFAPQPALVPINP